MGFKSIASFESKNFSEYLSNINTATKYSKIIAPAETFSRAFQTSYMVVDGLSHVNAILTKQRNKLNPQNRSDLPLNLTNFQWNINNLVTAHRAHPPISANYFTTKLC